MCESIDQTILKQYQLIRRVGKGAYGIVYEASHRLSGDRVAVKKCFGCFHNAVDAQRTYREVSALMFMRHPNIIQLRDAYVPPAPSQDLYLITEFVPIDLSSAIKANLLAGIHRVYITYQILSGLEYMHNSGLIHRDIKPSNILVNTSCHVRICDLGLVRHMHSSSATKTEYVATRWYRAPEIILGCTQYSFPVDIWATGTILAEMYIGKQLFPGTSTLNQLERILEFTGFPSDEDLVQLGGMSSLSLLQNVSNNSTVRSAAEFVSSASFVVLDLLRQMLQFAPTSRISAYGAMQHGAFARFHILKKSVNGKHAVARIDDTTRLTPGEYQAILDDEIKNWRMQAQNGSTQSSATIKIHHQIHGQSILTAHAGS